MLQRSQSARATSRRVESEKASLLKVRQDEALRKVFESRRRAQVWHVLTLRAPTSFCYGPGERAGCSAHGVVGVEWLLLSEKRMRLGGLVSCVEGTGSYLIRERFTW